MNADAPDTRPEPPQPAASVPHSPLPTPHSPHPLTDSPFFWLMLFGLAAFIGGVAIAPKYGRRMDRVERMHDARLKAYVERVGGDSSQLEVAEHREVSLRELLIFVAVLLLGGGAVGRWWEVTAARRRGHEPEQNELAQRLAEAPEA